MVGRFWLVVLATLGAASVATPSWAQKSKKEAEAKSADTEQAEEEGAQAAPDGEEQSAEGEGEGEGEDKESSAKGEESEAKEGEDKEAGDGASVVEKKGETYRFVGARYRLILIPKFMMNLFGDGGATVAVHSFGPEFAIRKDGFEYDFAITYAGYGMDPTPFKSKSDGEDAWELVESNMKVLYLTADFLWSHSFSPQLALNYGMGAGFGFVFGALERTQAYKDASGVYHPCDGPGNPPGFYCGADNNHYNGYEEPSWTDGGSKPVIFPWLAAQTGLRYKAHPKFVARFDTGFGLSGFFFGVGADYGL